MLLGSVTALGATLFRSMLCGVGPFAAGDQSPCDLQLLAKLLDSMPFCAESKLQSMHKHCWLS